MLMNTSNFGEITFQETDKIYFEEGLPGFEDKHEFLLLNNNDTEDPVPFMWLQSTEDADLALVVSIPFFLNTEYEFEISEEDCKQLALNSPEKVGVYSVCNIKDKVEEMTFNLMSPIIINSENRKAKQIILSDSKYKIDEKFQRK